MLRTINVSIPHTETGAVTITTNDNVTKADTVRVESTDNTVVETVTQRADSAHNPNTSLATHYDSNGNAIKTIGINPDVGNGTVETVTTDIVNNNVVTTLFEHADNTSEQTVVYNNPGVTTDFIQTFRTNGVLTKSITKDKPNANSNNSVREFVNNVETSLETTTVTETDNSATESVYDTTVNKVVEIVNISAPDASHNDAITVTTNDLVTNLSTETVSFTNNGVVEITSNVISTDFSAQFYEYKFQVNVANEWEHNDIKHIKANGQNLNEWDKFVSITAINGPDRGGTVNDMVNNPSSETA